MKSGQLTHAAAARRRDRRRGKPAMHVVCFLISTISLFVSADMVSSDTKHSPVASKRRKVAHGILRHESRIMNRVISPGNFSELIDLNVPNATNATADLAECQHGEGCQKQATYGMFRFNFPAAPIFCFKHALQESVFTKRGRCRYSLFRADRRFVTTIKMRCACARYAEGCSRSPCYGTSATSSPLFCPQHRNQLPVNICSLEFRTQTS